MPLNEATLNKATLKVRIETELTAGGFKLTDFTKALATAVANAVVDEITTNAKVTVPPGIAGGIFPVK